MLEGLRILCVVCIVSNDDQDRGQSSDAVEETEEFLEVAIESWPEWI